MVIYLPEDKRHLVHGGSGISRMVGVAVYPILVQHLHSTQDSLSVVIVERHLNIHTNNSHYGLRVGVPHSDTYVP